MGDCVFRSFQAAYLHHSIGINPPKISDFDEIKKYCKQVGLTVLEDGNPPSGNYPVIIIYRDNFTGTDDEYHAVYCSDASPVAFLDCIGIIFGFDNIKRS